MKTAEKMEAKKQKTGTHMLHIWPEPAEKAVILSIHFPVGQIPSLIAGIEASRQAALKAMNPKPKKRMAKRVSK
jgi:hypothetical protein